MTRYQLAFAPFLNKYINDELSKYYGGRRVTGVPPGLQNQCGALIPSRMGSIPICSRQKSIPSFPFLLFSWRLRFRNNHTTHLSVNPIAQV